MSERHAHFFGSDPEMSSYDSNIKAIEERYGNCWRVVCGHCGVTLCASVTDPPSKQTEIIWTNEGGWFGRFSVMQ